MCKNLPDYTKCVKIYPITQNVKKFTQLHEKCTNLPNYRKCVKITRLHKMCKHLPVYPFTRLIHNMCKNLPDFTAYLG